jgi:Family of unknown function (DUF6262)
MPADRAARLAEHARARHEHAMRRACAALAAIARDGQPVTVSRLAAEAAVSRSWIYTQPALRDQIDKLRQDTPARADPHRHQPSSRASDNSLRNRLELAHQKITQLRAENQQLRRDLASAHGQIRAATART